MAMLLVDHEPSPAPATILAKAATPAAQQLGIPQRELGDIIGTSPAAVSRTAHVGSLPADGKSIELATLFVRIFRALDTIVGGNDVVAAA